jgi:hypothetical protein
MKGTVKYRCEQTKIDDHERYADNELCYKIVPPNCEGALKEAGMHYVRER